MSENGPLEAPKAAGGATTGGPGPDGAADSEGLPRAQFAAISLIVIALAAAVRFLFISRYEVWLDEAYCFSVARRSLPGIVEALRLDNGPPLYYFLLHCWMAIFGESAVALRSLSAVFSTGAVALLVFWRAPWLPRRARLPAGFVLALTPLAVYYAQETRMYSPVLFFTLAATISLEKGLRLSRARDWAVFGLFTLLGLYTSYVAIFLVPLGYFVVGRMLWAGKPGREPGAKAPGAAAPGTGESNPAGLEGEETEEPGESRAAGPENEETAGPGESRPAGLESEETAGPGESRPAGLESEDAPAHPGPAEGAGRMAPNRGALRRLAGLLAAHAACAVLFLPWLPIFFEQPSARATQWIRPLWEHSNKALVPLRSLAVLTPGGAYYPDYLRQLRMDPGRAESLKAAIEAGRLSGPLPRALATVPTPLPFLLTAGLSLAAFAAALRRNRSGFPWRLLLLVWLALPIAVPLALSFWRPMYLVGRYELTALPAFAALLGIGLSGFSRELRAGALVLVGLLFLYSWGYTLSFAGRETRAEKARVVRELSEGGDVVLAEGFEYAPLFYYLGSARDDVEFVTFPRDVKTHAAWIDYERWFAGGRRSARPALRREAAEAVEEALSLLRDGPAPEEPGGPAPAGGAGAVEPPLTSGKAADAAAGGAAEARPSSPFAAGAGEGPGRRLAPPVGESQSQSGEPLRGGRTLFVLRPAGANAPWLRAMDAALLEAVRDAAGEELVPDREASRPELGIIVLRLREES